ncbi:MAG: hypothetical protein Q8R39_03380 [bacterium]|nr:hypothetical protein [bacterium]
MSATAVRYITTHLLRRKNSSLEREHFIIEYGSGDSTKFFVDELITANIVARYVAVERSPLWYARMLSYFPGGTTARNVWSLKDYVAFLRSESQNVWDVPPECRRLEREQKKMKTLRFIAEFLFRKNNFWFDEKYGVKIDCIDFEYAYIYEGFKDQYGESPNKHKYIRLPLTGLLEALQAGRKCHAVFIIDGGPRADIVKECFDLIDRYKNLTVDIFLLEAYRGYYESILSSRPGGRFIAAEKNEMLDGRAYLPEPHGSEAPLSACSVLLDAPTREAALLKELWHFTNVRE